MTEYEAASLAAQNAATLAACIVGGAQCLLIAWGIWIMRDSNRRREPLMESLRDQTAALREQTAALHESRDGIRALLKRDS